MHDDLPPSAASAYAYPLLIKQLLHRSLALHGAQTICDRHGRRMSYAAWRERVGRLASALQAMGVRRGSTVGIMDWDSPRYLETYFAVPMMGATMFTVNIRLSPEQIAYTLDDAKPSVLLVHVDFAEMLGSVLPRLRARPRIVVLRDDARQPLRELDACGEYEELLAAAGADFEFPDFDENTTAAVFYTTGTTGAPKGVCYSHRQIVLHALTAATALCSPRDGQRLHAQDVYMPITPMFHVLAWGIPYVAILLGLRIVLPGRYLPETLLELLQREQVSFSHCVPTILQMIVDLAEARDIRFPGWKVVIGGSALPAPLCKAALERGIDVFGGYGMSETGPIVALAQLVPELAPQEQLRARVSTGRALPMVDLRVVDEHMRDVVHDGRTQGEIVLRAPFLTQGYLHKPAESEELWRGGYLHTQDIAVVRPDGYVQIVDRLKDVIKTGGEWVSSIEIEHMIAEIPGVQEVAVIGVPDPKWGERPVAYVVHRPDTQVTVDDVRERLLAHVASNRVAKYAVPERSHILFVEQIPKTSVGKLNKKQLREWAAAIA
nr:fatty acid--CoA ligase [Thiomonas sp. FB-6]